MDGSEGLPGGWSAVVYGRTFQMDRWWRAHPEGLGENSPVGRAVHAAVAGGKRLEGGPRFLLSRGSHGLLVGAACYLDLVSDTMNQDANQPPRRLYGFVGWHSSEPSAAVPSLDDLRHEFAAWAGPVYREWASLTWDARSNRSADPRTSRPCPAPWKPLPSVVPGAGAASHEGPDGLLRTVGEPAAPDRTAAVWLPAERYLVHLLPGSAAAQLWAAALEHPKNDVTLVTGWREARDADLTGLTHLCSDDVTQYRRERLAAPAPPPRPAHAYSSWTREHPGPHGGVRGKQKPASGSSAGPDPLQGPKSPVPGASSTRSPLTGLRRNITELGRNISEVGRNITDAGRSLTELGRNIAGLGRGRDEFSSGFHGGPPEQQPSAHGGLRGPAAYDAPQDARRRQQDEEPGMFRRSTAPTPPPVFGRSREVEAENASYDSYFGGFDDEPSPSRGPAQPTAAPGSEALPPEQSAAGVPPLPDGGTGFPDSGSGRETRPDATGQQAHQDPPPGGNR
ncbi:hypothetical protein [Streptomyces sp. NPDC001315]|uniref:hypothetical protein n=1 Tax=Streptomyces sp. NPDC001315 TaxID=3364562 RepID=UPI0036CB3D29